VSGAVATGNKFHKQYSRPNKDFDRVRVRALLGENKVFSKQVDDCVIRGMYDDLNVILIDGKKYTSLIELKTTNKPYLWSLDLQAAIKQLQLYMYLLKDELERIEFPLWSTGYVEIYSQRTGTLMKRVPVEYDYEIEDWIRKVINQFKGLEKVSPPPFYYCKKCYPEIKKRCDWFAIRSRKE
jgi:CRISPR/Cas system-associated exonuclease Cas4 (RecB family)